MKIKQLVDENFQDYKKPSMLIATTKCDWKCLKERNLPTSICQNCKLAKGMTIEMSETMIIKRYLDNPITQAIIFAGLEPMFDIKDITWFIHQLRNKYHCNDDVVIYTGYYPEEVEDKINQLKQFDNIIVKFGRFIPDDTKRYDDVLGITLASHNQFAVKIS